MPRDSGSNGGERTEQERERAREERERRRLRRAASEAPPLPPPADLVRPVASSPLAESTDPRTAPLNAHVGQPSLSGEPPPAHAGQPSSLGEPPPAHAGQPSSSGEPPPAHAGQPSSSAEPPPAQRVSAYAPVAAIPAKRTRGTGRRVAAWIASPVLLMAIGFAVVLLSQHKARPKIPPTPKIAKLVIPEGLTRAQIALRAHAAGVSGNYLAASAHAPELDPRKYGAPQGTPNLEGFLFPATYEIYAGEPASRFVSRQLSAFEENFGVAQAHAAKALGITAYQLLIVASMVEREAQIPGDRAKIAAVIYNRLRAGMRLGIDATIYYAVERQKHIATYTGELTEAQLHIASPYNTRLHGGLPPTPISNPGLASIEAAAHPAHVAYLYYVAGADGCGEQVFSDTQSQFEADVAAYKTALARAGGTPPACKRGR